MALLRPEPTRRDDKRGRPWTDTREVINGVLWILRSGAQWQDLPDRFPPYKTCHRRFELAATGIEMIAPHKSNRVKPPTQDGRALRRYGRRWKVERLWAWLQNFRRVATRFDFHVENYLGYVHLGCIKILLRCYL